MAFKKCPRCELNYISDAETYCKVCLREMRGEETREEVELCTVCNEAPAMPGKEVCLFCWKEMQARGEAVEDAEGEPDAISMDDTVDDDIIPEIEEDIPEAEYQEINNDLSLEEMEEDENRDADDDEEDI